MPLSSSTEPTPSALAPAYAPPTLAPALAVARRVLHAGGSARQGRGRRTLFVVMGTSGSGKSTLGSALATALRCPFVDGDDLHPPANVRKMASGEPLDDADRLPWLRLVRDKALELTSGAGGARERSAEDQPTEEERRKRAMAEVRETSGLDGNEAKTPDVAASAAPSTSTATSPESSPAKHSRVVVIACSALKRSYRDVLRGSSSSASASDADGLQVVHIYLRVARAELQRRMQHRGAHFMKADMLASQLATLEEPDAAEEPGVVVVEDVPDRLDATQLPQQSTTTAGAVRTHSVQARFTIACPPGAEAQAEHLPTQGSRAALVAYPLSLAPSAPSQQEQMGSDKKGHREHLEAISRALGEVREAINEELTRQKERLGKWDLLGEAREEKQEDEEGEDEEEEESENE